MTISLPLPGLPGLTAVSIPVDVPVRDFVEELMALDKRWDFSMHQAFHHALTRSLV